MESQFGSDFYVFLIDFGYIFGYEMVGIVEEFGSVVFSFLKGEGVVVYYMRYCGFCEFCEGGIE